jgi:predicted transcriptional regulator
VKQGSFNPDQKRSLPTAAELRLLQVLWDIGSGSVEQIIGAFAASERPNYKTTQTLLRIMENKGFITHEAEGRVFIFKPLVSRETVDHRSVKALLDQNFGGSPANLFVNLLEAAPLADKDLTELEAYIQEYRRKEGKQEKGP